VHGDRIDEVGGGVGVGGKLQRGWEFAHFTEIYITSRIFERKGRLVSATHCEMESSCLPLTSVQMYKVVQI
jgi:hypothetical protein